MTSSTDEIEKLKARVCNGFMWLKENTDHYQYEKALKLYESLVRRIVGLGIKEKDCLPATEEDVDEIFLDKQLVIQYTGTVNK